MAHDFAYRIFIVGFHYYDGMKAEIFQSLSEGDEMILHQERDNPHDPLAIAILTKRGDRLGYVPRTCNYVAALIADQDVRLTAVIAEIFPEVALWERVLISLWEEA